MKTLLSKNRIRLIRLKGQADKNELDKLCLMAERHRQYSRQKTKRAKKKEKKYLKPTDYLTSRQFARALKTISNPKGIRAELNEMLVILLAETGLRASEVCHLRLADLPAFHGKPIIEVIAGKGNKDRTVGISEYLVKKLDEYIKKHHKGHSVKTPLFLSERGRGLSYAAIYSRIKIIGRKAELARLTPHKFRHTFATLLLDVTDNEFLIQNQLGHDKLTTTAIYTRTLNEKLRSAMNNFHNRLWQDFNTVLFENS